MTARIHALKRDLNTRVTLSHQIVGTIFINGPVFADKAARVAETCVRVDAPFLTPPCVRSEPGQRLAVES